MINTVKSLSYFPFCIICLPVLFYNLTTHQSPLYCVKGALGRLRMVVLNQNYLSDSTALCFAT